MFVYLLFQEEVCRLTTSEWPQLTASCVSREQIHSVAINRLRINSKTM